jgi:hypothetical protein
LRDARLVDRDLRPPLIPTVSRDRLPNTMSYPFGAEWLSALVSQHIPIGSSELAFVRRVRCTWVPSSEKGRARRVKAYELLRVSLVSLRAPLRWSFAVRAIPRELAGIVRAKLRAHGLPELPRWLARERQGPSGRERFAPAQLWPAGTHGLTVTWLEEDSELSVIAS